VNPVETVIQWFAFRRLIIALNDFSLTVICIVIKNGSLRLHLCREDDQFIYYDHGKM